MILWENVWPRSGQREAKEVEATEIDFYNSFFLALEIVGLGYDSFPSIRMFGLETNLAHTSGGERCWAHETLDLEAHFPCGWQFLECHMSFLIYFILCRLLDKVSFFIPGWPTIWDSSFSASWVDRHVTLHRTWGKNQDRTILATLSCQRFCSKVLWLFNPFISSLDKHYEAN